MSPARASHAWIRELARPYLRGYRARAAAGRSLSGYWFLSASKTSPQISRAGRRAITPESGYFVGYLLEAGEFSFLKPEPPESLVFAFVRPVGSPLHCRLVADPQSLLHGTFEYIRWLTHRPPRFEFYTREPIALVRHTSMRDWPREKREHFSRNFFIETLAWLVRSGLVKKLLAETAVESRARSPRR